MKNRLIWCMAMMFVCMVSMAKISDNLLPVPQQISVTGGSFTLGKVMLETSVLQPEWQKFIAEVGGEVVSKSSRKIEVKLVPEVKGAKLNQEEAYRLVVSSKGI